MTLHRCKSFRSELVAVLTTACVLTLFLSSNSTATTITIDFESFADGVNLDGVDLGDVTLSSSSGIVEVFDNRDTVGYHSATQAIFNGPPYPPGALVGVFDSPVSMVSLWAGDDHPDADDSWTLRVYDAAVGGNLLGTVTENAAPWDGSPYRELSLSGANILRFEASSDTGVGFDDLSYTLVPEPGTFALSLLGLMGIICGHRKRA
jgi:hypothetical protein